MFEAECPSCKATYQVDERRVPAEGLKMRCPKCGESFQVTSPGGSVPPVLGAALGLTPDEGGGPPPAPKRQATMLGVPTSPPVAAGGKRAAPATNQTMLGVAPDAGGFELAPLEEDTSSDLADDDELDLSATGAGRSEVPLPLRAPDSLDDDFLESVVPSQSNDELELPSLGEGAGGDDGFALPALSAALPTPVDAELPDLSADLPELGGGLPELGGGLPELGGGLPELGGELPDLGGNLPVRGGSLPAIPGELPDLIPGVVGAGPAPDESNELSDIQEEAQSLDGEELDFSGGGGLDLSGPPPAPSAGISDVGTSDDIFGQGPTMSPQTLPPPENSAAETATFGEVALGAPAGDGDDEFDAFPTETVAASEHTAGSAEGYGDVSLDGDDGEISLGTEVENDGVATSVQPVKLAGPQAAASASVELPTGDAQKSAPVEAKKRRHTSGLSQGTRIVMAAAVALAVGGGALSLLPDVGPYGAYFIIDAMNEDKYQAQLASDLQATQNRLALDTADEVDRAFSELALGRAAAPRFKERTAFVAYLGFLHQLRFGASNEASAQAQVLLGELAEADSATAYLGLARLAEKAAKGKFESVTAIGARLIGKSREHAVVVGEAALKTRSTELALSAWQAVLKLKEDPRANFGMARALRLAKKAAEAETFIAATLAENPKHAGASLLVARLHLTKLDRDEEVVKSLTPLSQGKGASDGEQVEALVLLGELHLRRSRIKKAEASFTKALKMDAGNAAAQKGLAQALFDSGRYSEALARFEASLQTDANDLDANLGLVRCKLRLEQLDDAVKHLDLLAKKHANSTAVAYWAGKGKESIGKKVDAEKAYEEAIEHGNDVAELVLSYIALTRLLGQKGNIKEADEVISQAEKRFPEDPTVYASLGALSSSRGNYDESIVHYDKALKLDSKNIGLKFARGVVRRQARHFDAARADFDAVEKESPEYPGLALERGNLYEAAGETAQALKAYEGALESAPDDLDLMLRVACGKAGAGQSDSVMEIIDRVLDKRGNSAEANFCKGLALLNGGKNADKAKRLFERAVSSDESRAKYHLYVGWVAIELQEFAKASKSLDRTIELDRTLADAYWKRGELRVRQGAVLDALADLKKALLMAPSRVEAQASRARALMQLGRESEALSAWAEAVQADKVEPAWNKDFGALLLANRRPKEARVQLRLAVDGAKKLSFEPAWLPTAHRLLAMSIGRRKEAVPHWEAFLKAKKGTDNPYLREALAELTAILNSAGY